MHKILPLLRLSILCLLLFATKMHARVVYVESQQEFTTAHNSAATNDSIIWKSGNYSGIYMNITKDRLFISADTLGKTVFTGASRVNISGDYIIFRGFQFLDGDIGTSDVINIRGSYNTITQLNINRYTCYKYLRVREESQYVDISYCNFENRLNLDDQNILSILVDANTPGYHKIQYCSFKNFDGTGNDMGIEPIRIGLSTQANNISRSVVEYCYFTKCDGDGELISSKASENVYRYNTFDNNPKAELVLRHGSDAIVYGNFFLNGKGGVRVREGQNHYIYNNYFYNLNDRAIYLQNEDSDPLDNINIAFNTVVECDEIILGGDGNDKPTNVTFANNIFTNPNQDLFEDATGTENWINNISFGSLGITAPTNGINRIDPNLIANSQNFFGLSQTSPAINAAVAGYASLPNFSGINGIDQSVAFDLMQQGRPSLITEKDLGCNEYPHNTIIQPIATEQNTGPNYNTKGTSNLKEINLIVNDLIAVNPNPVSDQLTITAFNEQPATLHLAIFNNEGKLVSSIERKTKFSGDISMSEDVSHLPSGSYTIRATSKNKKGITRIQAIKLIKLK